MFLFLLLFLHINTFIVTEQSHTFWILKGKMINIFEPFHSFISVQSSPVLIKTIIVSNSN